MSTARQIGALCLWGLQSLPSRPGVFLTGFVSVVLVAAVLTSLLSMGDGIHRLAVNNARPDRLVALSRGAPNPAESSISRDAYRTLANDERVRRDAEGHPLATGSITQAVDVVARNGRPDNVFIRGITNPRVYPEIRLLRGRWPRPGVHELLVSTKARQLIRGLEISDLVPIRGADWRIVGSFGETGDVLDLSLVADAETIMAAVGRTSYEEVVLVMRSPAEIPAYVASMSADPTLMADVYREAVIREQTFAGVRRFLDFVSYFIGAIMAGAATCAALSSTYATVDARSPELATLRAIGFARHSIVVSVIAEATLIALLGALLGSSIAWLAFSGRIITTNALTFPLITGAHEFLISALWVLGIALLGAALPALRASRL
ncbi:MAG TPA: FtsX-like permease family protein [Steroidobacteraceae bacterium]|nr:FtsX-like permease family protein [Steroidobacteraceae bacterium]